MEYIIIWKNCHRNPFVDINTHSFKETYSTYKEAKDAAESVIEAEGSKSEWYFDYAIYKEVTQ